MIAFFQHLFRTLDEEREGWRENTIILLDNAAYHKAAAVLDLFAKENVKLMFTGPYSYAAAPCEVSNIIRSTADGFQSNSAVLCIAALCLVQERRHQPKETENGQEVSTCCWQH